MLKEKRKNLGLTQPQMAKKLGVSLRTICFYESYERFPIACDLIKFKKGYGMTDKELMEYLKFISKIK